MRRRLKFFLICFFFVIYATNSFAEVNLPDLIKIIQPAVATIITFDADNEPIGQGSGFFIDVQGHFITNYHVLQGAYKAVIKTYDGKLILVKSVTAQNKLMDLVKVIVNIPETSFKWIPVTTVLPKIAENIVVIGSPLGLEQTISVGIISGVRDIPETGKILQISASISPGSSGSPVVNMEGQVVGIVTSQIKEGQSLNFAIPVTYLIDMVPLKDSKTIAEWSDAIVKNPLRKENKSSSLFVQTEPEGAMIRILNIKPKFQQGIELNPGRYHVEVSAEGYKIKKQWIRLEPDKENRITVQLERTKEKLRKKEITTEAKDDDLATILNVIKEKETEQTRIEAIGKKRKERKIAELKSDIAKYDQIVSSPFGKKMKEKAWKALINKYPREKDLETGDIEGFKERAKFMYIFEDLLPPPGQRFIKWNDCVVCDLNHNLRWYAGPNKDTTWEEAKSWVASLDKGYESWRMPTIEELKSLYQEGVGARNITPLLETTGWVVWSGETWESSALWNFGTNRAGKRLLKRNFSKSARGFAVSSKRKIGKFILVKPKKSSNGTLDE
jgi:hypothetical protein